MPTRDEQRKARARAKLNKDLATILATLRGMVCGGAELNDEELESLTKVVMDELAATATRLLNRQPEELIIF